jgi:cell division transport system ATP-binding protein
MIRFDNVSKHYANHQALQSVSFELDSGEMAFLTGHSGAGKSTLLKLIMMIERPSQGHIFVGQHNLTRLAEKHIPQHRRKIGMVFQNPRLLQQRNIFDNIALPLVIAGYHYDDIKKRVRAALDKVGLIRKEALLPVELSYGEQQRVGIARAVVNKPEILLADEPTGNLDPDLSQEIMQLFAAFNAVGVTVLIATHDIDMINKLNQRRITLSCGQLI